MSFGPLICVICQDNRFPILTVFKIPLSEAVKAPTTALEEVLDVEKDVVDGHLHFHDEGVASLFIIDDKEPLEVEVSEEELEVFATVPSAIKEPPVEVIKEKLKVRAAVPSSICIMYRFRTRVFLGLF